MPGEKSVLEGCERQAGLLLVERDTIPLSHGYNRVTMRKAVSEHCVPCFLEESCICKDVNDGVWDSCT